MMLALALVLTLGADELTPDKAAQVQHDRDKAMADVSKKYGNKKSSELSSDERREMIRDQREADKQVLEKNGVEAKDMARYEARMNLSDREATKAAKERIEQKEAADKKAAEAKAKAQPQEVQVQRGFNDNNPVTLEDNPNGQPIVEKGLPQEAQDDQAAAGQRTDDEGAVAPAKKSAKGKK